MTLEEPASAAGMNTSFLHSIETSKKKPRLNMAQKIALALRVPVAALFSGAPSDIPAPDPYSSKLAALVSDVDVRRRRTIPRVVKTIVRDAAG